MDEQRNQPAAPPLSSGGPGHLVTKNCMGCSRWKLTAGGTGVGVRWRCAACVETREARRAQPA